MEKQFKQLSKKVKQMELGNPVITTLVGLVIFYIGLKMFSGGMKSMGNLDHLSYFTHNIYYMFLGGTLKAESEIMSGEWFRIKGD